MTKWQPDSWKSKSQLQQADYPDVNKVEQVLTKIHGLPPLVTALEIKKLKGQLAEAAQGKRFLLQGGDCAEAFANCNSSTITNKLKILLQMSLILLHGMKKPIVRVGRIAGQYAKPRSSDMETKNGITLPSFRGDIINRQEFTETARAHDPERMLEAYHCASTTLNYIRARSHDGFSDLHHSEYWNLDFMNDTPLAKDYKNIIGNITQSIDLLYTITGFESDKLSSVDFFTSHEALLLPYEQALTHKVNQHYYNLGTHFPWIGMRTGQLDGAHLEYLSGIDNPVAIKIGPSATMSWVKAMIEKLNPKNEGGRLTLIHRFGCEKIAELLPKLIETVHETGITVLWTCDPMHGNTRSTDQGIKTRSFEDILSELKQAFNLHEKYQTPLGGVHFEMTGENVTECTGGASNLSDEDLHKAYESHLDPRLNYEQALEMAMLIAHQV